VLLLEEGHCLREQALQICREAGATEVGDVRATSLTTLLQMVAGGLGITLLPAIASPDAGAGAERDGRGQPERGAAGGTRVEGVVVRPIVPAPTRTIGLVWRATSPRAPEFVMLAETLRRGLPPGAQPRE
jgi:LysR family hydrogen peroxide-inducible transcriptional activator